MATLFYDRVPNCKDTWIEYLGHLGRYRFVMKLPEPLFSSFCPSGFPTPIYLLFPLLGFLTPFPPPLPLPLFGLRYTHPTILLYDSYQN